MAEEGANTGRQRRLGATEEARADQDRIREVKEANA